MWTILKKIIGAPIELVILILKNPRVRYRSNLYRRLKDAITYNEVEGLIDSVMAHVHSSRMKGDYLEFGVFTGRSFITSFHMAKNYRFHDMKFFALDSFAGLPASDSAKEFNRFEKGFCYCDFDTFRGNVRKAGIADDQYQVIKGFFNESLTKPAAQYGIGKAAIIMIDSDLYESAVEALNFCTPILQDGTVLIFDEWFAYRGHPEKGERKAFYEWIKANNLRYTELYHHRRQGMSFIIHLE